MPFLVGDLVPMVAVLRDVFIAVHMEKYATSRLGRAREGVRPASSEWVCLGQVATDWRVMGRLLNHTPSPPPSAYFSSSWRSTRETAGGHFALLTTGRCSPWRRSPLNSSWSQKVRLSSETDEGLSGCSLFPQKGRRRRFLCSFPRL